MECPVCFSAAEVEPAVRESMNIGILVLLGVTTGVLTCFARFFLALARRSRTAAHLVQHDETSVGRVFSDPAMSACVGRVFSDPATSAGPKGPALPADATS